MSFSVTILGSSSAKPTPTLNLDDEEVPLFMQEGESEGREPGDAENDRQTFYLEILIACIAGLALLLLLIWWWKRKKKDSDEEKEKNKD